jgi:CelD/BcsL family acetyltransferase involved in cellulose biosynthesis
MTGAITIERLRPRELTPAELAAWARLQAEAGPDYTSPFLSPDWAVAVDRALEGDRGVGVAVARRGGEPVAFFAARPGRLTALPPGAPLCDYQGVVAAPGTPVEPSALLQALRVQRYDFSHMVAADAAFGPHARGVQDSWVVDVAAGWDAYEADRRAAGTDILRDIAKKRRKLEREFGEVSFTPMSRSREDFETLLAWKRAQFRRTRQTDVTAPTWVGRLLNDLFERPDPEFGGALFTLHVGGRLAAAQFNLRGPAEVHSWLIGHDDAFLRCSPGLVLFGDMLRWMAGSPWRALDLGPVAFGFKDRLANRARRVAYGFAGRPSPVTAVRAVQYGVRGLAERLPLGRASAWPGKAMRRLDLIRALV